MILLRIHFPTLDLGNLVMMKTHTDSEVMSVKVTTIIHRKILSNIIFNHYFSFISVNKRGGKIMYPIN